MQMLYFSTEMCVTILLKHLPESTATRILGACVHHDKMLCFTTTEHMCYITLETLNQIELQQEF